MGVTVRDLTNQGFEALSLSGQNLSVERDVIIARSRQLGADYVIFPTLTKTSDGFTLSGQLLALNPNGVSSPRMDVISPLSENLEYSASRLILLLTDHLFGTGPRVVSVAIVGSSILESQALLNSLRIRVGGTYNAVKAASDIKRLYSSGNYSDVNVQVEDVSGGKSVKFVVTERPRILFVDYAGNEKYDADDLNKIVGLQQMEIASDDRMIQAVNNIKQFYYEKGYTQVKVTYELTPTPDGRARVLFIIEEGKKQYIKTIDFVGNSFYSDWKLSRQIESSTKGFFSFITDSGKLDQEKLRRDRELLMLFYHNNGFITAQVGAPEVVPSVDGDYYTVTFAIEEGQRYRINEVTIVGDLKEDDNVQEMLAFLKIPGETWANRQITMQDVGSLLTYYRDKGYFHVDVNFEYLPVPEDVISGGGQNLINVEFQVYPRTLVYFDRIQIVGNERTRDKVIRRQLEIAEGDLTSETKLVASENNLMRSGFFEEVNLAPSTSDSLNQELLDLRVEVKERPTGSFMIGAGYSNYSNIFATVSITQKNLFGYGRSLGLEGNIGGNYNLFNFSFTDPWVADIPLMLGFNIFKAYSEYDYYVKDSIGGSIRAGYPVFEQFYLTGSYTWEDVDISEVISLSQYLNSVMGTSRNSVVNVSLLRDTRNHYFQPNRGSSLRFSFGLASSFLGGQTAFTRYEIEAAKWIPLPFVDGMALMGHIELGYAHASREGGLPIYEKYMLGGIDSLRGYDWYEVSPKDPLTGETIGGEKMGLINLEITFPLLPGSGLFGVFFYDMGNVWTNEESINYGDLRRSYGAGLRYLSPMGPLRIEYGRALDPYPGSPTSRWEFSMGAMF
jgi:outer membrane protein insertion porin family